MKIVVNLGSEQIDQRSKTPHRREAIYRIRQMKKPGTRRCKLGDRNEHPTFALLSQDFLLSIFERIDCLIVSFFALSMRV